ncbi:MAG TPA: regulatory iron-sulfur-containing complex subunit RicT [Armatimonadota bacterium]|jgi:cell fate regulator YaaT (PSP1 superfamily)
MPMVVGLVFEETGAIHFYAPGEADVRAGDFVVAETCGRPELARVALAPREMDPTRLPATLHPVMRVASEEDKARLAENRALEDRTRSVAPGIIEMLDLPMKMIDVEAAFEGGKVTVFFAADGRIDFRELVRELANALNVRVQMHQLGARDHAKMVGGLASCGRELCCATWMRMFEPVSMRMAKEQSLFLNPSKFSGNCGKLKCCLRYEYDFYTEAHEAAPIVGDNFETPEGWGRVSDVSLAKGSFTVDVPDAGPVEMKLHLSAEPAIECDEHPPDA